MKTVLNSLIITVVLILAEILPAVAQKPLKLLAAESRVTISGTSTLHDWEENVSRFDASVSLLSAGAGNTRIGNVKFISESASIVSENTLMTNKTQEALRSDKYPEIIFSSSEISEPEQKGKVFTGSISGDLFLNGVTRRITVNFSGTVNGDKIEVTGSEIINMSDYNIKSPTALLGTLKTGDKVSVAFILHFITDQIK